jgi:hypothetical protein
MLLMAECKAAELGLSVKARIRSYADAEQAWVQDLGYWVLRDGHRVLTRSRREWSVEGIELRGGYRVLTRSRREWSVEGIELRGGYRVLTRSRRDLSPSPKPINPKP